ncbi:unnamed protein product [Orchesella dallaii]|uniref:Caveolin n=1 Tax=Orchesella dallaii TaxID=48710 RepID=A0ABP1S2S4_9HEXA
MAINQITKVGMTQEQTSSLLRDPLHVNNHLQVEWTSVIGEPESLKSPEWVWNLSNICFIFFQAATYRLLTVFLAPVCSIIIATVSAILAFLQIWFARPIIKCLHLIAWFTRTVVELILKGTIGPFFEMLGLVMSKVKLQHQRMYDVKDEPEFPFTV